MPTTPDGDLYYLEFVTRDVDGTCAVLTDLHGWAFGEGTPELGNARVAVLPNGARCGVRAPMAETEHPITRAYVRVHDVRAAVDRAAARGAEVGLIPTELPGHGTIAIFFVGGVEHGVWEPPAPGA